MGEFEQRLRRVIDEVQASAKPIILFVDEVHTLVGARRGPSALERRLKPALAQAPAYDRRDDVGGLTKYIEKDPARPGAFKWLQVPAG